MPKFEARPVWPQAWVLSFLPRVPLLCWTGLLKLFQRNVPLAIPDLGEPRFALPFFSVHYKCHDFVL